MAATDFFKAGITRQRLTTFLPLLLLVTAFLLGGTSGYYPIRATLIGLLAVLVLTVTLLSWEGRPPAKDAIFGVLVVLGLPLVQLIPLPPSIWTALPGRDVQSDTAALLDPKMWQPLSLNASATWRAWLSLLAPVAMFLAMQQIPAKDRICYAWAVTGIAAFSMLFGLIQVAAGGPHLFQSAHNNFPVGLFANRNHQAALGYVGAIFAVALAMRSGARRSGSWVAAVAVGVVLVAVTLTTASRMGVALLALSLVCSGLLLFHRTRARMVLLGLAVAAASALLLQYSHVGRTIVERFARGFSDERSVFWPEVLYGVRAYFPAGSGFGTFASSYQAIEPLGSVTPVYLNHAHNDYLELAMEAGVIGIAALVVFLAALAWRARAVLRAPRLDDSTLIARTALIGVVALLLHSLADYPLRTYALLTLFGMLLGMLWVPSREPKVLALAGRGSNGSRGVVDAGDATPAVSRNGRPATISRPIGQAVVIGIGLLLAVMILRLGIEDNGQLTLHPQQELQEGVMSSTDSAATQAEAFADRNDMRRAQQLSLEALGMSLQNARALRVVARAANAAGETGVADTAMTLAARLGWRDGFAQIWMLDQALQQRDFVTAAQAGDALMRTQFHPEVVMPRLQRLLATPAGRAALVARMAENPPWMQQFFGYLSDQMPGSTPQVALLLEELGRVGNRPADGGTDQLFRTAISQGQAAQLVGAWQQLNGGIVEDPRTGVVDGNFDLLAAADAGAVGSGPFGWKIPQQSGATVTTPPRSEGNVGPVLHISLPREGVGGVVASQLLILAPGRYELTYLAVLERGSVNALRLELQCQSGEIILREFVIGTSARDWSLRRLTFNVPGKCASQTLNIKASAAFGDMEMGLDGLGIRRR